MRNRSNACFWPIQLFPLKGHHHMKYTPSMSFSTATYTVSLVCSVYKKLPRWAVVFSFMHFFSHDKAAVVMTLTGLCFSHFLSSSCVVLRVIWLPRFFPSILPNRWNYDRNMLLIATAKWTICVHLNNVVHSFGEITSINHILKQLCRTALIPASTKTLQRSEKYY